MFFFVMIWSEDLPTRFNITFSLTLTKSLLTRAHIVMPDLGDIGEERKKGKELGREDKS